MLNHTDGVNDYDLFGISKNVSITVATPHEQIKQANNSISYGLAKWNKSPSFK